MTPENQKYTQTTLPCRANNPAVCVRSCPECDSVSVSLSLDGANNHAKYAKSFDKRSAGVKALSVIFSFSLRFDLMPRKLTRKLCCIIRRTFPESPIALPGLLLPLLFPLSFAFEFLIGFCRRSRYICHHICHLLSQQTHTVRSQ